MRNVVAFVLCGAFLTILAACVDKRPTPTAGERATSLVDLFPEGSASGEAASILTRQHVVRGFDFSSRKTESFRWSRGERSTLEFFVEQLRPLTLSLHCAAFSDSRVELPPQTIEVLVNDASVKRVAVAPEPSIYEIDLPANFLLPRSKNKLELAYGWTRSPKKLGLSRDSRQLAVRCSEIRPGTSESAVERKTQKGASSSAGDMAQLHIPPDARATYYLNLEQGAVLRWTSAGTPGEILVEVSQEGQAPVSRRVEARAQTFELPIDNAGVHRVELLAVPGAESSVVLNQPTISGLAPGEVLPEPVVAERPQQPSPRLAAGDTLPEIFVYLVDTLRADYLGAYGGPAQLTPNLDDFARESMVYRRASSTSSWTQPAVASLFTGLAPETHGVRKIHGRMTAAVKVLPEWLGPLGYQSSAISNNQLIREQTGFNRGFDRFHLLSTQTHMAVIDHFEKWLRDDPTEPELFYVHTSEPHSPYDPPPEIRLAREIDPSAVGTEEKLKAIRAMASGDERDKAVATIRTLYEGEVMEADHNFGRFLDLLKKQERYEEALVIFTADHGEELGEHGEVRHGRNLFRPTVEIPMIVKAPASWSIARGESWENVSLIDLTATILAAAGAAPIDAEGKPLLGQDLFGEVAPHGPRFASLHTMGLPLRSLMFAEWQLLYEDGALFPRLLEFGNELDMAVEHPIRAAWLEHHLRRHQANQQDRNDATLAPLDQPMREELLALGYVVD